MRNFIYLLTIATFFSSCRKEEEIAEFWDVLNCYMIINKTTDNVNLRMDYPVLTCKELHPRDTLKFLIQQSERQPGTPFDEPFNTADTCILTIKGKEFHYNKQDSSKGNPLFFNNYMVEKKSELYFNLIFYIEEQNYKKQ